MTEKSGRLRMLKSGEMVSGRYEVQELIADGGRRRTFLAYDMKMGRIVALSVVRPECAHLDPKGVEREAMVLGGVGSHDSIVSVFDVVMDGPLQFVVFEYMGGGTLADYVTKEGPIPLEQLLRLARQVCRGLAHLHNKGLLHRDVCAKNVLLDERGAAHLGDFDSAIWLEDPEEEELPQTPNRYAAPEELRGKQAGLLLLNLFAGLLALCDGGWKG